MDLVSLLLKKTPPKPPQGASVHVRRHLVMKVKENQVEEVRRTLMVIGNSVTMAELCSATQISMQRLKNLVSELEANGEVVRRGTEVVPAMHLLR